MCNERSNPSLIQSSDEDGSSTELESTSPDEHADEPEKDRSDSDNVSDEITPPSTSVDVQSLIMGSHVFCKWHYDHILSPGVIHEVRNRKFTIAFDDGMRCDVKPNEIICQSYLQTDQHVMVQTQDNFFDSIVKRLIKKGGELGYIIEKNGKEKFYPMRSISLTREQANHLPLLHAPIEGSSSSMGKRKRTSTSSESSNKKTSNTGFITSWNKIQHSTFTPTQQKNIFTEMKFLLTGFNGMINIRKIIDDTIKSHGGKVIEKLPTATRYDNYFLISDIARKTSKFINAKEKMYPVSITNGLNNRLKKVSFNSGKNIRFQQVTRPTMTTTTSILSAVALSATASHGQ